MSLRIDIDVDWNTMDDTGLPWTCVSEAADPNKIMPGEYVIAGRDRRLEIARSASMSCFGDLRPNPGRS